MNIGVTRVMYSVLIPKLFPRKITARIRRGTEIPKVIYSIGIPVIVENIIDNPVIPPGAKPVDLKNKFTAIAVKKAERVIHKYSFANDLFFIRPPYLKKLSGESFLF